MANVTVDSGVFLKFPRRARGQLQPVGIFGKISAVDTADTLKLALKNVYSVILTPNNGAIVATEGRTFLDAVYSTSTKKLTFNVSQEASLVTAVGAGAAGAYIGIFGQ